MTRAKPILLIVLLACTKPEPPPPPTELKPAPPVVQLPVRTDRARYVMGEGPFGPETKIVTTFTAPKDKPLYLMNCNGQFSIGLQRLEGERWVYAWSVEMNACLSEPIVIPAGGTRAGSMTVASGVDALVSSRRTERKVGAGTYRAAWHGLYTSFDVKARPWGEELPLEQRVSAPFTIEEAPPPDPSRTSPAERPAEIASIEPAHAASVAARAPIRIRFAPGVQLNGEPHLYIDGEWIESAKGMDDHGLEYVPRRKWPPGRHDVRVIYQTNDRNTRWYAWHFIAAGD